MENRRRIGNDYTFTWPFEVRVDEQTTEPYDLTGRVFQLYMVGQLEAFEIPADEIEVDGNEITWTWHGKDQRYPGLYNAKLIENGGEDGMITVDVKYAVTLVPHTWQEGGSDDGCISLESVELVATEVSMTPGPRGPQGEQGPAGPQGATGPAGPQGAPGTAGPQGPEGKSAYEVAVDNGFEGTEEEWLESLHGGPRGPQGYSAYEVAVNEGYEGTETEWLASLKGETGATGATGPQGPQGVQGATGPQGPTGATGAQGQQGETGPQGPQGETGATGATGPQGKSAYQVAVDNGYSGTEVQWLASLKGDTGATGPQGPKGETGDTGATGPQGETGATGSQGPKGDTGDPGITSAEATVDGNTGTPAVQASIVNKKLTLAFSNLKGETGATGAQGPQGVQGETGATGAQGPKGDDGDPGITSATATVDANTGTPAVTATITNKVLNLAFSNLKGETGPAGPTGSSGANGVGIASVVQTTESSTPGGTNVITITKTDGTSSTVNVRNGDAVGTVAIVQDTGNSTTAAMSQDGTTKAIQAVSDELGWAARTVELTPSDYANVIWGGDKWYASNANFNGYVAKVHAGATVTVSTVPSTKGRVMLFADKPEVGVSTPSGSYLDVAGGTSYTVPFSFTVPEGKEWLFFGVALSSTTKDASFSETGNGLLQMYKEFSDSGVSPQTIEENSERIDDLYTKTGWTDVEEWTIPANTNTNHYFTTDFNLPIRFTYWTNNPASDMSGSSHKEMRLVEYNGDTALVTHSFYLDETHTITIATFNSATTRLLIYGATQYSAAVDYSMTMEHIGSLNAELETRIESTGLRDYSELKCVCLGDSITESLGSVTTYPDYLHNISKMDVYGCGFGGSDWAQRAEQSATPTLANAYAAFDLVNLVKSWCDNDFTYVDAAQAFLVSSQGDDNSAQIARLKAQSVANTDLVIIMSGVNDFTRNKVLGDADSTSKNEVSGAINLVVQYLLTANPNLVIYFANNKRYWANGNFTDAGLSDNITNSLSLHLSDYNDCIARQAAKWNIPICDVHDSLGFNMYNHGVYMNSDGAHCTSKGYEIIARKIWSFIKANEIF